jgi:glycerophosphoryl diester phosphodiesterase
LLTLLLLSLGTRAVADEPARPSKEAAAAAVPLARAHAHNDYAHRRPLLDALDQGFCSVEADIFLVKDQLLVAHSVVDLNSSRTLDKLYLAPLRERIAQNGGDVYRGGPAFTLMIDFKTEAEPTYDALKKVLAPYHDLITCVKDGKVEDRAISIVLSGSRPSDTIAKENERYVGLDGRMGDLDSDSPAHLMPWVSDSWSKHFKWDGKGALSDAERAKLREFATKAHAHGRKLRLWGAPDNADAWRELNTAGVDLINTDDLAGLAKFLRANGQDKKPGDQAPSAK